MRGNGRYQLVLGLALAASPAFLGYLLVAAAARRPVTVGITWVGRRPGRLQIVLPYCPLALAVATSLTLQVRGEGSGPFLYWTFVAWCC